MVLSFRCSLLHCDQTFPRLQRKGEREMEYFVHMQMMLFPPVLPLPLPLSPLLPKHQLLSQPRLVWVAPSRHPIRSLTENNARNNESTDDSCQNRRCVSATSPQKIHGFAPSIRGHTLLNSVPYSFLFNAIHTIA